LAGERSEVEISEMEMEMEIIILYYGNEDER
jgi:hypothetical protein